MSTRVTSEEKLTSSFIRSERYYQRVGRAETPGQMDLAMRRGRWEIGDRAVFPSGSSSSGSRRGEIVACGPVRAKIKFTFKNGRESQVTVPYALLKRF